MSIAVQIKKKTMVILYMDRRKSVKEFNKKHFFLFFYIRLGNLPTYILLNVCDARSQSEQEE